MLILIPPDGKIVGSDHQDDQVGRAGIEPRIYIELYIINMVSTPAFMFEITIKCRDRFRRIRGVPTRTWTMRSGDVRPRSNIIDIYRCFGN